MQLFFLKSNRLTQFIAKLQIFEKTAVYSLGKMPKIGLKIICELSIPSERAHFKLLNATFLF